VAILDKLISLRRCWPPRHLDLLMRACALPEERARGAWQAWTRERDFDQISWPEIRLVAFLAERIATLDPQSPLRPRVEGLARANWTRNQSKLRGLVELHDALQAQAIPSLIFKGASVHAEGIASLRRRVIGDVDLLVRPQDISRALEVMLATGWQSVNGESPENLRAVIPNRRGTNFRKDAYAEIDLHQYSMRLSRGSQPDDELWANARQVTLLGRTVLVPDAAESLVIGLMHGLNAPNGDWALDAVARLASGDFDWTRLLDTTRRRGPVPHVRAGLIYLKEALEQPVPQDVLDQLARAKVGWPIHLHFWCHARQGRARNPLERLAGVASNAGLRASGYRQDRPSVLQEMRANPLWRYLPRRRLPAERNTWAIEHELSLGEAARGRLIVAVAVNRPAISRRMFFDISIDGIGIARARSRTGGAQAGSECVLWFAVRLPTRHDGPGVLRIESRPVSYRSPMLDPAARAKVAPVEFRIESAALAF
jgi:hypothetical protein